MAIGHSRTANAPRRPQTQTSSQPATAATSEVDNCCFVDRQCSTDQEWTDGFWGLSERSMRCGRTDSDTGAHIDWACRHYFGRYWQLLLRRLAMPFPTRIGRPGSMHFRNNQCKHRDVTIEGSGPFVARVEAALDMLKTRAPYWYTFATSGIDRIKEAANAEVTVVYVDAGEVNITRDRAFRDELHGDPVETAVMWLASLIIKDACHIDLFRTGMLYSGLDRRTDLPRKANTSEGSARSLTTGFSLVLHSCSRISRTLNINGGIKSVATEGKKAYP